MCKIKEIQRKKTNKMHCSVMLKCIAPAPTDNAIPFHEEMHSIMLNSHEEMKC